MGFFSWNCRGCGHPLLSGYAAKPINQWMINGVAVTRKNRVILGGYDGYGNLDGVRIDADMRWKKNGDSSGDPDVYHQACWDIMGQPKKYKGGSKSAPDQGFFFDQVDHAVSQPKVLADLKKAMKLAEQVAARWAETWKKEAPLPAPPPKAGAR